MQLHLVGKLLEIRIGLELETIRAEILGAVIRPKMHQMLDALLLVERRRLHIAERILLDRFFEALLDRVGEPEAAVVSEGGILMKELILGRGSSSSVEELTLAHAGG